MVLAAGLAVDAVEEGVDHRVAALDPQPGEESLGALPGLADQDAAHHGLVHARVLPDDQ